MDSGEKFPIPWNHGPGNILGQDAGSSWRREIARDVPVENVDTPPKLIASMP
jgi:hypothetical protein